MEGGERVDRGFRRDCWRMEADEHMMEVGRDMADGEGMQLDT